MSKGLSDGQTLVIAFPSSCLGGQAVYHAKLSWKWEAKKNNKVAAEAFIKLNTRLLLATDPEAVVRQVNEFEAEILRMNQLDKGSVVHDGPKIEPKRSFGFPVNI